MFEKLEAKWAEEDRRRVEARAELKRRVLIFTAILVIAAVALFFAMRR